MNKNLLKSLAVLGIILLGCGTAIALEEHSSPADNAAVSQAPINSNPSVAPGSSAANDPSLASSAQIAQTTPSQSDQPQMESGLVGQQASSEPKESGSQSSGQAIPSAPAVPTQKADVLPGDQGNVNVSKDAPPTKTENPSERQQAPTEAPSGHTATTPHPSSDYPTSDHDLDEHASHTNDKPHTDNGDKKGSDKQD